jgi:hypothetical protein
MAVTVCGSLAYPVLAPDSERAVSLADTFTPTPIPSATVVEPDPETPVPSETPMMEQRETIPLPTQGQILPPSEDPHILYYTIAGDSLPVVSLHFGVDMNTITSPNPMERESLLPPGQLLIIPNKLSETTSTHKLLPDSEVTCSPSTIDFDIDGFVQEAGGYLATYEEYLASTGWTSGADIIGRVALEYSVNPRLLLAFLEFNSGWVYGFPDPDDEITLTYPMGYVNSMRKNLYL